MSPDVPATLQRADAAFFPGGHRRAARGRDPYLPKKWGWREQGEQQERGWGSAVEQRGAGSRGAALAAGDVQAEIV